MFKSQLAYCSTDSAICLKLKKKYNESHPSFLILFFDRIGGWNGGKKENAESPLLKTSLAHKRA